MKYTHDLIVIGAGAGGLGAAGFGGLIGLKVALIDKSAKNFGGDCLNYGCIPSKALLHIASQFAGGKSAERFGAQFSGKADFTKIMDHVHNLQDVIRAHESPEYMREQYGLETIIGHAKFVGPRSVEVNDQVLSAPKIVLATGSKARELKIPGIEQVKLYDNEGLFWSLNELPEHLLVIGGGPIGCEMGQAFRRLGSRVTIVNLGSRLLAKDPAPMGNILQDCLEREGVEIRNETEVAAFTSPGTADLLDHTDGSIQEITFSHVLNAAGRKVVTEGLALEKADIRVDDGRMVTNDRYRTTNRNVFAVGDALGREQFSHGAEKHNIDLWNNLLSPIKKSHRLKHFSWVTFTDPQVASFGWTEADLKAEGTDFEVVDQPFDKDDRAIAAEYRYGLLRLYLGKGSAIRSPKILGGCMIAPQAGEIIQELLLLNQQGKSLSALTQKIYAYPVASRINQKPARDRVEQQTLSPRIKRIMKWWYRFRFGKPD
ncbi:MAG: NAD(P)/FAD-dependent oxidoreductase [Bacteroidota bacterium]